MNFVGMLCAAILFAAAAFHLYWGAGGLIGIVVSVPLEADGTPVVQPGRLATAAAGLVIATAMISALAVFQIIALPVPMPMIHISAGGWAIVFFARAISWHRAMGFFKKIRNTRFVAFDTWLYSPVRLVLAFGLVLGALSPYIQ